MRIRLKMTDGYLIRLDLGGLVSDAQKAILNCFTAEQTMNPSFLICTLSERRVTTDIAEQRRSYIWSDYTT